MKLLDLQDPFFIPLWRRVATVAVCFAWGAFEWINSPFWGILFVGIGAVCAWGFFFNFNPRPAANADTTTTDGEQDE